MWLLGVFVFLDIVIVCILAFFLGWTLDEAFEKWWTGAGIIILGAILVVIWRISRSK
jgi:hypothetical protein